MSPKGLTLLSPRANEKDWRFIRLGIRKIRRNEVSGSMELKDRARLLLYLSPAASHYFKLADIRNRMKTPISTSKIL